MSNVVEFPPPADGSPPSIIGPAFAGHRVVVDGRVIPRLACHELPDGSIGIVLDGRYSHVCSAEHAHRTAWIIAQALAIGAGYPSFEADAVTRPFAPTMMTVDSVSTE